MRTALSRYCLPLLVSAALPALTQASIAFSVKRDGAEVFRGERLDPPPMASLEQGQVLKLIAKGSAASLVETETGIKGWVRNEDLLAMADAEGQAFRMREVPITPEPGFNHSFDFQGMTHWDADTLVPDRSFTREIPESLDKEQVEMRHDEN